MLANHVLCVVSDAYPKTPCSSLERNAAFGQTAGKRPGFVLLVVFMPCRFPTPGDPIKRRALLEHVQAD